MTKPLFYILLLLIMTPYQLSAQSLQKQIIGQVLDQKSHQPIANVEVFISGTTIGTITDRNGEFLLTTPHLPCHLVVMHVSYQLMVSNITSPGRFDIKLTKVVHHIDAVSVSAKDKRRKNLRLFYKYFLMYANTNQIKVLNDSVLQFERTETDFHARCESPLLVQNNYLGYQIKILIQDFHVCKKQPSTSKKVKLNAASGTGVFKLLGYHYYTETEAKSDQKQKAIQHHRRSHYHGSLRHFLTSLYQKKLDTNGYALRAMADTLVLEQPFVMTAQEAASKHYQFAADKVYVSYSHNPYNEPVDLNDKMNLYRTVTSTLISLGHGFEVRPNGTSPNLLFEIIGPMGQRSPANSLPNDYLPEAEVVLENINASRQ